MFKQLAMHHWPRYAFRQEAELWVENLRYSCFFQSLFVLLKYYWLILCGPINNVRSCY